MIPGKKNGDTGTGILLLALRDPAQMKNFTPAEWDLLLRTARRSRLLGRLAVIAEERGELDLLPEKVRDHFRAARVFVTHYQRTARWEVNRLLVALDELDVRLILLKGSAYILAGLPPSRGRLLSDVDILLPRKFLDRVEKTLLAAGWKSVKLEDYDQRYDRTWMHELPPLRHPERLIEVDLHHTISPLTSRLSPDPGSMIADSIPLPDHRLRIPGPADMVLHSTVHLFHDGEFINGLRDLVDLTDLMQEFGGQADFWDKLVSKARKQGMLRPLFYMLRYSQRLLGASVPADTLAAVAADKPSVPVLRLMDKLVEAVMVPGHPDFPARSFALAQWLLYVRSHWLRMPPWMLLQHLARKKVMRWRQGKTAARAQG